MAYFLKVIVLCPFALCVDFTVGTTLYFKRSPETFKYYSSFTDGQTEVRAAKTIQIISSRARTRTYSLYCQTSPQTRKNNAKSRLKIITHNKKAENDLNEMSSSTIDWLDFIAHAQPEINVFSEWVYQTDRTIHCDMSWLLVVLAAQLNLIG